MSAIAPAPPIGDGWRRPSLFRLTAAVLAGEILGAVVLWIAVGALALIGAAPFGGATTWVWLPWKIDGVWALAGAIGWGYLVCTLIGRLVAEAIERRGYGRPAAGWMRISIAVSGYGAMAVGRTPGAHVATAVITGAVLIRLIPLDLDGSPRAWGWHPSRRTRAAGTIVAVVIALSYSGLHAFAADGDGGTFGSGTIYAHVGHTEVVSVGLSHLLLPVQITGVSLGGSGTGHISAAGLVISPDPGVELIPNTLRSYPGAHRFSGFVWQPTRLPYRVGAGTDAWINLTVKLSSCGRATVNRLTLRYTVLGIGTGETIPLQQPLRLSCRR